MNGESNESRVFYDEFLSHRMLDYRIYGNRRIQLAIQRVLTVTTPTSHVLEIGCGIGMVAERIARRARHGHVWACDLSESNVAFARGSVRRKNIDFFACDVLSDFDEVKRRVSSVDVVAMVDVLEHLPPLESI